HHQYRNPDSYRQLCLLRLDHGRDQRPPVLVRTFASTEMDLSRHSSGIRAHRGRRPGAEHKARPHHHGKGEAPVILILFGSFILFLLAGLPVAFSTGLSALIVVIVEPAVQERLLITKTFGGMDSFTLMAIPFFILAGEVMSRSGLTRRIVDLAAA